MFRFRQEQRLKNAAELTEIIKRGKRFSESCLAFYFAPNQCDYARLGLMIGKRYCALAADRNRLKRLIREQFRLNQSRFKNKDVVIRLISSTQKISDAKSQEECIKALFQQAIDFCDLHSRN